MSSIRLPTPDEIKPSLLSTSTDSQKVELFHTYLKETQDEDAIALEFVTASARAVTTVGGAIVGAEVGAIAGSYVSPGPGTIIGTIAGGAFGAYGGYKIGSWIIFKSRVKFFNYSLRSETWQLAKMQEKAFEIFNRFIHEDGQLNDYICPISRELPLLPVTTICNHTFDFLIISAWIQSSPRHDCPMCRRVLTDTVLVFNARRVREIWDRIEDLSRNLIPTRSPEEKIIKEDFEIFKNELRAVIEKIYILERRSITARIREAGMGHDEEERLFDALEHRHCILRR